MEAPEKRDFAGDNHEVQLNPTTVRFFRIAWSGDRYSWDLPCTGEELFRWKHGQTLMPAAMPSLTDDQREFIISGCLPGEWEELFDEDEDEEE